MSAAQTLTAAVHREEDWYVAQCLEVDVASQGPTIDEALANLAEAVELYLDEVDDPARHVTSTPLVTSFRLPGGCVSPALSDLPVGKITPRAGISRVRLRAHQGESRRLPQLRRTGSW